MKDRKRRMKHAVGKKGKMDDPLKTDQFTIDDELVEESLEKNQSEPLKNKKRRKSRKNEAEFTIDDKLVEESLEKNQSKPLKNKKRRKSRKDEVEPVAANKLYQIEGGSDVENGLDSDGHENKEYRPRRKKGIDKEQAEVDQQNGDAAKLKKFSKKKNHIQSLKKEGNMPEKKDCTEDAVYQISSGDEDCSKGMKKWIMEYHQHRPGLDVLQQRIDDFITAHESRVEQEKKEREAKAAEDGWTVVVHHKGRKKTTEVDTGVTVGSVSLAAAQDHQQSKKKKNKEMSDFYRFQRREARKNEIMMLQSKFEQDKKRIQQMRAARKFRPY